MTSLMPWCGSSYARLGDARKEARYPAWVYSTIKRHQQRESDVSSHTKHQVLLFPNKQSSIHVDMSALQRYADAYHTHVDCISYANSAKILYLIEQSVRKVPIGDLYFAFVNLLKDKDKAVNAPYISRWYTIARNNSWKDASTRPKNLFSFLQIQGLTIHFLGLDELNNLFFFSFRMASPGKSPCKPHCQLRGTINSIGRIKNDVELQSNGVSMVLTRNRALRASLNKDVPPVIDTLESALKDVQRLPSRLSMLETKVYIIKHKKKLLKQQLVTIRKGNPRGSMSATTLRWRVEDWSPDGYISELLIHYISHFCSTGLGLISHRIG